MAVYKLHLTRSELETAAAALQDHQDLSGAAVISEKISMMISYAALSEESLRLKNKAANQKRIYSEFIKTGSKALDLDDLADLEVLSDPE